MYSCIYMQGWLHDGEHLRVWSSNFELQQGYMHHTQIIKGSIIQMLNVPMNFIYRRFNQF